MIDHLVIESLAVERGGRRLFAGLDASLRAGDPDSGIRDFEWLDGLAQAAGLRLIEDRAMPANNRCLIWQQGAQA